jgi:hypothetical protein
VRAVIRSSSVVTRAQISLSRASNWLFGVWRPLGFIVGQAVHRLFVFSELRAFLSGSHCRAAIRT